MDKPKSLAVHAQIGYDGQYFYRLALDPLTSKKVAFGITLDSGPKRQQRFLYPAIVWVLSAGGNPTAVLWLLVALNLIALCLTAWGGAELAHTSGRSPLLGLLFAAVPGLLIGLAFDTAEPVAICFATLAFVLLRKGRFGFASMLLGAAILTRETTLIFALGLLICVVWRLLIREPLEISGRRVPLSAALAPVIAYAGWQGLLWNQWGDAPLFASGRSDLGMPLLGIVRAVSHWGSDPVRLRLDNFLLFGTVIFFLVWSLFSLRTSSALPHERLALGLALPLTLFFQATVWAHYANFLRALAEGSILALIVLVGDHRRPLLPTSFVALELWGYLAFRIRSLD